MRSWQIADNLASTGIKKCFLQLLASDFRVSENTVDSWTTISKEDNSNVPLIEPCRCILFEKTDPARYNQGCCQYSKQAFLMLIINEHTWIVFVWKDFISRESLASNLNCEGYFLPWQKLQLQNLFLSSWKNPIFICFCIQSPKSESLMWPLTSTRILSGLRSQWT